MSSKPRPSLASLGDRLAKKEPLPAPAALSEPSDITTSTATKAPTKDTRVQVLVRMTPAERKALRRIALDQDTTVQALVEEAIRDLLRRHGG